MGCKCFLSICRLSLHSVVSFFVQKNSYFDVISFVCFCFCCLYFGQIYIKNCLEQCQIFFLWFYSFRSHLSKSLIHWVGFLYMKWDKNLISFVCIWISSFPNNIVKESILSSMCVLRTFVKNRLPVHAWVHFWALNSIVFHWLMNLLLCQNYTVLVLWYGSVMPRLCSFSTRLPWLFRVFYGSWRILGLFSVSMKTKNFGRDCTESICGLLWEVWTYSQY